MIGFCFLSFLFFLKHVNEVIDGAGVASKGFLSLD